MDPSWIEFQAEFEYIQVVPNFTAPKIDLLQCDVGPFKAGIPLTIPIWLGLSFRQRQKCRIIQPDWMTVNNLEEVKEAEKQRRDKQIDRTDGLLAAFNSQNTEELPLLESSGEKTRKTYDFTRKYSLVMALGQRAGTSMPKL